MDKQIEEMKKHIKNSLSGVLEIEIDKLAEELMKYYQPKIPDGAVVIPKERKCILANKVYADATLKCWKKEDLIDLIRILEHNWASAEESLDIQAKNCEMLLKQAYNKAVMKFAERLKTECFDGGIDDKWVAVSFSRLDEIAKELQK